MDSDSPKSHKNKSKRKNMSISERKNHRESGLHTPISLIQSESEAATLEAFEYVVPTEITKGYTECFFGYGKYLYKINRIKEGIHNLLQCASWYDDNFVDPSCLTSLILPPQFLFQDSVKKRHCINFRTLAKFISKILSDKQKKLDKQFKQLNIAKYQREYDQYVLQWQERNIINIPTDREDRNNDINHDNTLPETSLVENITRYAIFEYILFIMLLKCFNIIKWCKQSNFIVCPFGFQNQLSLYIDQCEQH